MRFFAERDDVVPNALNLRLTMGKSKYREPFSLRRLYRIEGEGFIANGYSWVFKCEALFAEPLSPIL